MSNKQGALGVGIGPEAGTLSLAQPRSIDECEKPELYVVAGAGVCKCRILLSD